VAVDVTVEAELPVVVLVTDRFVLVLEFVAVLVDVAVVV
jgi:hypothetical protein